MRQRIGIALLTFLVCFVPTVASAGIGELIWEMSGPQFAGGNIRCRTRLDVWKPQCYVSPAFIAKTADPGQRVKVWLSIEGGVYVSTGKNRTDEFGNEFDYRFASVAMFGFEPIVEFLSPLEKVLPFLPEGDIENKDALTIYHGVGYMLDGFVLNNPGPFAMDGVKFRVIGVAFKGYEFDFNLRVYRHGTTPDQFGFAPPLGDVDRPSETSLSFGFSVPWLSWRIGK